jgi:hypothetical protein
LLQPLPQIVVSAAMASPTDERGEGHWLALAGASKMVLDYRKAQKNRAKADRIEAATGLYLLSNSNINAQKFTAMYFLGKFLGKGPRGTWFGHNYTGDGNKDDFAKFNTYNTRKRIEKAFQFKIGVEFLNQNFFKDNPISNEEILGFLLITKLLAPRAKSFSDKLAVGHDRDVPSANLSGNACKHIRADSGYVSGYLNGLATGEAFWQPLDSFVGFGGSLLFTVDAGISSLRSGFGGCK